MDQFTSILTAVLTIATIIAGALAGMQRGIVTNLRETANDLRNRATDLEKDRDNYKIQCEELEADVAALGRAVRNEAYLTALGDRLDEHHEEARKHWGRDEEFSKQMLDAIRSIERREP